MSDSQHDPNTLWPEHPALIVPGYEAVPGLGPTMLFPVADLDDDANELADCDLEVQRLHDEKGILAYDDYHCADEDCDCGCFFLEVWKGGHALLSGGPPDLVIYLVGELGTHRLRFGNGVIPTAEAEALRAELEATFWPETWELMSHRRCEVLEWFTRLRMADAPPLKSQLH